MNLNAMVRRHAAAAFRQRWLALLVANTDAWRDDAEQDAAEV